LPRSVFVVGAIVASALASRTASADLTACIASSEHAISLRRSGKLGAARRELALCSATTCPEEVRTDCTRRIEAVNSAMPSLVVRASDGAGNDLTAAELRIDGTPVASMLDGRPLEIDPGEHTVRVEARGLRPAERKLVVGEGEKNRHESFVLGAPPPVVVVPPPPPTPVERGLDTRRKLAVTTGVIGLAGLGAGGVLGGLAASEWSNAKRDITAQASCASAAVCPAHNNAVNERSTALTYATASTVALGVGGVLVVAGLITWFTDPGPSSAHTTGVGPKVVPAIGTNSGGLTVAGEF
jgi:hypothetical protein